MKQCQEKRTTLNLLGICLADITCIKYLLSGKMGSFFLYEKATTTTSSVADKKIRGCGSPEVLYHMV